MSYLSHLIKNLAVAAHAATDCLAHAVHAFLPFVKIKHHQPANPLPSEVVDGCSGGVSWFYRKFMGRDIGCVYCCNEHDLAYEEGGTPADRKLADLRLRQCIKKSGRPVRAWLFWATVRAFGWRYWPGEVKAGAAMTEAQTIKETFFSR